MAITNTHPLSQKLLPVFNEAGLNLKICPHPKSMKWSKLLINLMGNASSAILNMDPVEIYSDKALYNLELRQLRETLGVMKLIKVKPINLPGVPVRLLAFTIQYLPQQLSQPLISKVIGGGRGGKMPSFHIDLYSGRGKSEVDQLNGAVVRTGIAVNYPTPVNEILTNVLNALIQGKEPLEKYAFKPEALFALLADN
jgi:2-dehydropantoate 2-reductase